MRGLMQLKPIIGVALFVMATGAQAQLYKCTDNNGRTSFSDKPCGGALSSDANAIEVTPENFGGALATEKQIQENQQYSPAPRSYSGSRPAQGPCRQFSSSELRKAIIQKRVLIGMSLSDARSAWGSPSSVNGDQYAYHWGSASAYFYTRGGCVSSVQGSYQGPNAVR